MELGDQKIKETRAVRLVEAAPPPFASKIMSIHHLLFMCVFFFHCLSTSNTIFRVTPTKQGFTQRNPKGHTNPGEAGE